MIMSTKKEKTSFRVFKAFFYILAGYFAITVGTKIFSVVGTILLTLAFVVVTWFALRTIFKNVPQITPDTDETSKPVDNPDEIGSTHHDDGSTIPQRPPESAEELLYRLMKSGKKDK